MELQHRKPAARVAERLMIGLMNPGQNLTKQSGCTRERDGLPDNPESRAAVGRALAR